MQLFTALLPRHLSSTHLKRNSPSFQPTPHHHFPRSFPFTWIAPSIHQGCQPEKGTPDPSCSLTLRIRFISKAFQLELWHLSQINPLHTSALPTLLLWVAITSSWTIASTQVSVPSLWSASPQSILRMAARSFKNLSQVMLLSGLKSIYCSPLAFVFFIFFSFHLFLLVGG